VELIPVGNVTIGVISSSSLPLQADIHFYFLTRKLPNYQSRMMGMYKEVNTHRLQINVIP
jgi:hypothetical protein